MLLPKARYLPSRVQFRVRVLEPVHRSPHTALNQPTGACTYHPHLVGHHVCAALVHMARGLQLALSGISASDVLYETLKSYSYVCGAGPAHLPSSKHRHDWEDNVARDEGPVTERVAGRTLQQRPQRRACTGSTCSACPAPPPGRPAAPARAPPAAGQPVDLAEHVKIADPDCRRSDGSESQ